MSISFCLMLVEANVEKTIFLAPIPIHASPKDYSSLYGLHLGTLTPSKPSLQTRLTAVFPSEKNGISGFDSWFLLDELESQRRYEQPTSFNIWTHHFDAVVDTSKLNNSLWSFGRIWQNQGEQHLSSLGTVDKSPVIANSQFHGLLLQISAAADYYTTNKKLMKDVPPVKVDISAITSYTLLYPPRAILLQSRSPLGISQALSGGGWIRYLTQRLSTLQIQFRKRETERPGSMDRLPAELILHVLSGLDILDFPSLIFAIFAVLRRHSIAPALSMRRIELMRHSSLAPQSPRRGIHSLPPELRLQVGRTLNPREKVNFVIATWSVIEWDLHDR
ncbi:hypothetical protein MMC06_000493 [Schaereria dolodes]|nr:hypothetical protein [Schaereria dolodes]